jgi:hypothetical protein
MREKERLARADQDVDATSMPYPPLRKRDATLGAGRWAERVSRGSVVKESHRRIPCKSMKS